MNKRLLCVLLINVSLFMFSQVKNDSITGQKKQNAHWIVGVDLLRPALSLFSQQKSGEVLLSMPVHKKWRANLTTGYAARHYDDAGWKLEAHGPYLKLGATYRLSKDPNPDMGYYIGIQAGYAHYALKVNQYLVQQGSESQVYPGFPEEKASAYWIEPLVGGRVQLLKSRWYLDVGIQLRILVGGQSDNGIQTLVAPGFGENKSGLNLGVRWALVYPFSL